MKEEFGMEDKNLRDKTVGGIIWMFMERIGAQVVTFVVSLVLARLLLPDDYGIIAIAEIFISLANVFVVQGLNSSLIQRDQADDEEYSTAFYASLILATILYLALFFLSPLISNYYGKSILTPIFRVLGLRLPLGALNSIQRAYVSRNLQFKKFFFATLGGTIISAFVGIGMAYAGLGPWAIVGQYLTNSTIDTIVLWFTVKWHPKKLFSFEKLKDMFGFSWKIFLAAFFNEIYLELRSMVIGKKYTSEDLAYYNRGKQFPQLFYSNIASSITSVMFPVMSRKKDDPENLKRALKRTIQVASYILFPLMAGLIAVAHPLVEVLLTSKWFACVVYLQAYAFCYAILPIQSIFEQMYKALGRSDIILKLFFIEKIVGVAVIVITMQYSVWMIAVGMIITSVFSTILHVFLGKRTIGYSFLDLFLDIKDGLFLSVIMLIIISVLNILNLPAIVNLFLQCAIGGVVYIAFSVVLKVSSFKYLLQMVNGRLKNEQLNSLVKRL